MGLTQGMNLNFYTSVAKHLKLKVRKFWALIPTFVEVTGEKLVGEGAFCPLPLPTLSRVKLRFCEVLTVINSVTRILLTERLYIFRTIKC